MVDIHVRTLVSFTLSKDDGPSHNSYTMPFLDYLVNGLSEVLELTHVRGFKR